MRCKVPQLQSHRWDWPLVVSDAADRDDLEQRWEFNIAARWVLAKINGYRKADYCADLNNAIRSEQPSADMFTVEALDRLLDRVDLRQRRAGNPDWREESISAVYPPPPAFRVDSRTMRDAA